MGLFPGAYVEKMILPKKLITAQVVYSYAATDTDKISISENEVIEILKEGEFIYYRVSHIETEFLNWLWGIEGPIFFFIYGA